MTHQLEQAQPARAVAIGDTVIGTPHLTVCCLILVRTPAGIMAQHWPGTDLALLDPNLFPGAPTEMLMVTGNDNPYQREQAHALQLRYPGGHLSYYAFNGPNYPTPFVYVGATQFLLQGIANYHAVMY